MQIVIVTASLGLAVFYWLVWIGRPISTTRAMFKTLPVALLAAAVWHAQGMSPLCVALVLSALGDWFLARDGASNDGDRAFKLGVVAFAAAHLGFLWAMMDHRMGDFDHAVRQGKPMFFAITAGFAAMYGAFLYTKAGRMGPFVVAYIPFILMLVWGGFMLPSIGPFGFVHWGVMLFVLSDGILALNMFVVPRNGIAFRLTRHMVWVTYYPGVLAIVMGLCILPMK